MPDKFPPLGEEIRRELSQHGYEHIADQYNELLYHYNKLKRSYGLLLIENDDWPGNTRYLTDEMAQDV